MFRWVRKIWRRLFRKERQWQCILCGKQEPIYQVKDEHGGFVIHHCPEMFGPFRVMTEIFGGRMPKAKIREGDLSVTIFADQTK